MAELTIFDGKESVSWVFLFNPLFPYHLQISNPTQITILLVGFYLRSHLTNVWVFGGSDTVIRQVQLRKVTADRRALVAESKGLTLEFADGTDGAVGVDADQAQETLPPFIALQG